MHLMVWETVNKDVLFTRVTSVIVVSIIRPTIQVISWVVKSTVCCLINVSRRIISFCAGFEAKLSTKDENNTNTNECTQNYTNNCTNRKTAIIIFIIFITRSFVILDWNEPILLQIVMKIWFVMDRKGYAKLMQHFQMALTYLDYFGKIASGFFQSSRRCFFSTSKRFQAYDNRFRLNAYPIASLWNSTL